MIVLATIHDPDAITAVLAAVHLADASIRCTNSTW